MATQKVSLSNLNKVLPHNLTKKGGKKRRVTSHNRNDQVAAELAKCNSASEVGAFAMRFGLSEREVRTRAKAAPNFGQYRMVIGNRIRGIVNRIRKAKQKGVKLSPAAAAYPKGDVASKVPVKKAKKASKRKR